MVEIRLNELNAGGQIGEELTKKALAGCFDAARLSTCVLLLSS